MGWCDMPLHGHPLRDGVRDHSNQYVSGRGGGRDIDLRRFAAEGMELLGTLSGVGGGEWLRFETNLRDNLNWADRAYNDLNAAIDKHIEKAGLAAPAGSVYRPAWQPSAERRAREPAPAHSGHHVGVVVHRLRCRLRLDRRCRCSTRAGGPFTGAASPRIEDSISAGCRGSTPGARGALQVSHAMRFYIAEQIEAHAASLGAPPRRAGAPVPVV